MILGLFSFFFFMASFMEGAEIRALIDQIEMVRLDLMREQALYKGDYAFTDFIYSASHAKNLNDEFVRIREYHLTRWNQKAVVIVHKIRDLHEQNHRMAFHEECDTVEQALSHIPMNFVMRCSFFRQGWEYRLNEMRIFIEEIEGLPPSIEIVAPSRDEICSLFEKFKIGKILSDSVPEWYCKSKTKVPLIQ